MIMRRALILAAVAAAANAVEIVSRPQTLYADVSNSLRIYGSGWQEAWADGAVDNLIDVQLDGAASDVEFTAAIEKSTGMDFRITLSKTGSTKWAKPDEDSQGISVYLTGLAIDGTSLVASNTAVKVATVIPSPYVDIPTPSNTSKDKSVIVLQGKALKQKSLELTFAKEDNGFELTEGIDYSVEVIDSRSVNLRLYDGKVWRSTEGPLILTHIDTGAGKLRVTPPGYDPITLADIVDGGSNVVVDAHANTLLYWDEEILYIRGSNFPTTGDVRVRFSGAITQDEDYTVDTASSTAEKLVLKLVPGKFWRRSSGSLPGYLRVMAITNENGQMQAVGSANEGKIVGRVYKRPLVSQGSAQLRMTESHTLSIFGEGFVMLGNGTTTVEFDPPIDADRYSLTVKSSKEAEVHLLSGKWREDPGPLFVGTVNTGPGAVTVHVQVATVVSDSEMHESGIRVTQRSSDERLYPSSPTMVIMGENFPSSVTSLDFAPESRMSSDSYDITSVTADTITLRLKQGKTWLDSQEQEFVVLVSINGVKFAGEQGVAVAKVFPEPRIQVESVKHIYASHTKTFYLDGSFTGVDQHPAMHIQPTLAAAFEATVEDFITLKMSLKPDGRWGNVATGETLDMVITGMDNGAGVFDLPEPITVAVIYPDNNDNVCEDSCYWANDGHCDENSFDDSSEFFDDDDLYYGGGDYDDYASGGASVLCQPGTDCTDCGGLMAASHSCDNSCIWHNDNQCDDPRGSGVCPMGTDCHDCGPMGEGNFTVGDFEDDYLESYNPYLDGDMDDDLWLLDNYEDTHDAVQERWDGWIGADGQRYTKRNTKIYSEGSGGSSFITVLEAMAWIVGCGTGLGLLFVGYKKAQGGDVAIVNEYMGTMAMGNGAGGQTKYSKVPTTEKDVELAARDKEYRD